MSAGEIGAADIKRAYARWAPFYDATFGKITITGRREAVLVANRRSGQVLEVGVGTGIALPLYSRHLTVTGIDLSEDMLRIARERVGAEQLRHVTGVMAMDAGRLAFADETFETVVAMYLITVVPDPEAVMAELERVCKVGGEVVLVNHFSAEGGVRGAVEKALAPLGNWLGWRPEFPFSRVTGRPNLQLLEHRPVALGGLFSLVRFRRTA